MLETLLILVTAHLLGDFLLYGERMRQHRRHPAVLLLHAVLVAAATALLLGSFHPWLLGLVLTSHLVIDAVEVYCPAGIRTFVIDQLVHGVVLVAGAMWFPSAAADGLWMSLLRPDMQGRFYQGAALLSGVLLCVPAGGVLIGILTVPLVEEIRQGRGGSAEEDDLAGLRRGGRYIGWLERALVMMLLLIEQPSGIGFLFAAKSIMRFGEVKDSHQRRLAEYIIIGTLLSFGWALLVSYLTQQTIALWAAGPAP